MRTEYEILQDINGLYMDLSPENISRDGMRSHSQVLKEARKINQQLKKLFKELGREVDEYGVMEELRDLRGRRSAKQTMRRSASEVIRNLEMRIARLERTSSSNNLDAFVSKLQSMLGNGIEVDTQLEMTESHGKTYTIFINPFADERPTDFFMTRGRSYRGYEPTPQLKKKVSRVSRSFKKAIIMSDGVEIGLDGQLNKPVMRADSEGERFYNDNNADYRWEIFVYDD